MDLLPILLTGSPASSTEEVQTAAWTLLLAVAGAISTVTAAAAILWRIVRPHVDRYVRTVVEPVARGVREVREEVRPEEGDSVRDHAVRAVAAAEKTSRQLDGLARGMRRQERRLEAVEERLEGVQEFIDLRIERGDRIVAAAEEALGVKLRGDDEEDT